MIITGSIKYLDEMGVSFVHAGPVSESDGSKTITVDVKAGEVLLLLKDSFGGGSVTAQEAGRFVITIGHGVITVNSEPDNPCDDAFMREISS